MHPTYSKACFKQTKLKKYLSISAQLHKASSEYNNIRSMPTVMTRRYLHILFSKQINSYANPSKRLLLMFKNTFMYIYVNDKGLLAI